MSRDPLDAITDLAAVRAGDGVRWQATLLSIVLDDAAIEALGRNALVHAVSSTEVLTWARHEAAIEKKNDRIHQLERSLGAQLNELDRLRGRIAELEGTVP